jgi:lysophospholipase L1-like esterase
MMLWRIQNGELPSNINPSIFWLLIGTNDIGRTWCSPEMVVLGVIRNVEEILSQRPSSRVVVNGIFPRSFNKDGFVAKGGPIKPSVWEDIKVINHELKMYATYRDGVSYFETKVFFKDPKAPQLQIDQELMPDLLHPSPTGYKLWGEEIVAELDTLLMDEYNGEANDPNGP